MSQGLCETVWYCWWCYVQRRNTRKTRLRKDASEKLTKQSDTPPQLWSERQGRERVENIAYIAAFISHSEGSRMAVKSRSPKYRIKSSWRERANGFVNPSAGISFVGTQVTFILPFWACSRSQCWRISTCRRFVLSFGDSVFIRPTVWVLSQKISGLWPGLNPSCAKKRFHHALCPGTTFYIRIYRNGVKGITPA